jgi:hypothetical protein
MPVVATTAPRPSFDGALGAGELNGGLRKARYR